VTRIPDFGEFGDQRLRAQDFAVDENAVEIEDDGVGSIRHDDLPTPRGASWQFDTLPLARQQRAGRCKWNRLERSRADAQLRRMSSRRPFRKTSPEIFRLPAMLCVRFPFSLRNVEDLLHEHGVEVTHETVRTS
jgi:hypothetical protein